MLTVEQARETKAGPLLDELFCVVCYKWYRIVGDNDKSMTPYWVNDDDNVYERLPPVSTDANACESWAMRWCAENKLSWRIDKTGRRGECRAELFGTCGGVAEICTHAYGTDWKESFVRACVVAAINLQAKGT